MRYILAVVALWALAIMATAVMVADRGVFTYLGPLYSVCTIGSVVVVRRAAASGKPRV